MDTLRNTVAFYKKLKNNEIDHGDILAFRLAAIMSKLLVWWTDMDYKKAPKWAKVVYMLLTIRFTTLMILSIVDLGLHWNSKPLSLALNDLALLTGGVLASSNCWLCPYNRSRTSTLLRTINEINLDILKRKQNAYENRETSNRLFRVLSILCASFNALIWVVVALYAWQFRITGLPLFNTFLYQPTPFSVIAFIDVIQILTVGLWAMSLCSCYLSMYFEFILRISFYFRVTAREMRDLRRGPTVDEDEELRKLKSLIKDLNVLYLCVDEFNGTLRVYMILFFWHIFTAMGMFAAVLLSMGISMKLLPFLFMPIYMFSLTVTFCAIGQHLKDSADEVNDGIYGCDWYSAPIPFRKLVLNVLTRSTREVLFTASPFYDLDFVLLYRVLKTTYSLLAVFANALK